MVDRSQKHPFTSALNAAYAKQVEVIGFASIMTIDNQATLLGKKYHCQGKCKKRAEVAAVSAGVGILPYIPIKLPPGKLISRQWWSA